MIVYSLIALNIIFRFLAGKQEGFMELSAHGKTRKDLQMGESWDKKWYYSKFGMSSVGRTVQVKRLWYYLWSLKLQPKYIEAYPYSSTLLVWTTDFWHKKKMLRNAYSFLSILSGVSTPFILAYFGHYTFSSTLLVFWILYPLTNWLVFHLGWKWVYLRGDKGNIKKII